MAEYQGKKLHLINLDQYVKVNLDTEREICCVVSDEQVKELCLVTLICPYENNLKKKF